MDPEAPLLVIEGLRFAWPGGDSLLTLGHLELRPGERLFIEGPSGSGKSTLLSLIAGVVRPEPGSIRLAGQDLGAIGSRRADRLRADHIGLIFQQFNLIPYLDAIDNVLLGVRFSRRRQKRCGNALAEASRLLSHMGIEILDRPVRQLSVGQQQRIACARALIGRPALVMADEPTSALDPPMRERFLELLFNECREAGSALLFVSHDHQLASRFDRRIVLGEP